MPIFKTAQTVQLGWIESLESKIEEQALVADKPKPPPKPKAAPSAKFVLIDHIWFNCIITHSLGSGRKLLQEVVAVAVISFLKF